MEASRIPYIPETAPFTLEQRAWLNGFLAGLFAHVPPGSVEPDAQTSGTGKTGEPLLIMFGSQTGTAEGLAKRLGKESEARGFTPTVLALNDYARANLPEARRLLVVTSTWGDGDPPDNAANFWDWLKSPQAPRLENLSYGVLGLGDKNYADFCGASRKFDSRLEELGAHRIVPRGECDVEYEVGAKNWVDGIWEKLGINGTPFNGKANGNGHLSVPKHGKANPFLAKVLKNVVLNKTGSTKEVRHYEISLAGSGLEYSVGDALGVLPENCPMLVGDILAYLKCTGDEEVEWSGTKLAVRDALTTKLDISKPSTDLLAAVARRVPSCEFAGILSADRPAELKRWLWGKDVLDILGYLSRPLSPSELVTLLRKLAPRLYSISSSPKAHREEVHLTVGTVRYESLGRNRKGVCSTFLAERCEATRVFVQASHGFKLPADGSLPIIMVGPGTGIAPFRAFLEEREAVGAKGRNWLFFGDQKRASDFLYEEQLSQWVIRSHLTRLDLAFSRDQTEKVYVQHRMLENASELWRWLEEGAHFYVCGDASRMAGDVDAALHCVVETAGGKTADEAKCYVAKLKSDKRYQRDVY